MIACLVLGIVASLRYDDHALQGNAGGRQQSRKDAARLKRQWRYRQQRVRHSLEYLNRSSKLPVRVEFSIGITAWKPTMDWQAMYQLADKELYADKRSRHSARRKVGDGRG